MNAEKTIAEFHKLCGDILSPNINADKDEIKRLTKDMIDIGRQDIMEKEFRRMGSILNNR
jgi:hypothetical protein